MKMTNRDGQEEEERGRKGYKTGCDKRGKDVEGEMKEKKAGTCEEKSDRTGERERETNGKPIS